MPNVEQIQQALMQVIDPELGRNIVECGMVKDIHIDGNAVKVVLALTVATCPLRNQLQEQTRAAAESVEGVENVVVELTSMTPVEREQLMDSLRSSVHMNKIGRMIAIMSGKGGVGKSSVTAMLATELRRRGFSVGVMDADITGPSIPRMFGITGPVRGTPLGILPIETRTGIKVMSTNLMLSEEDMAIIWRGPVMTGAIKQFWKDVLWGHIDYLLIDLPPGTSDATLTVMQSLPVDGVVMVTTPQGLASMVVRKTVHMAQQLEVTILGIVENMSFYLCPDTGKEHAIFGPSHALEVAKLADAPVLGRLPLLPDLAQLADMGWIEKFENAAYTSLSSAFLLMAPPAKDAPQEEAIAPDEAQSTAEQSTPEANAASALVEEE
jgi:Mrp family chromosome partitioning ATPase